MKFTTSLQSLIYRILSPYFKRNIGLVLVSFGLLGCSSSRAPATFRYADIPSKAERVQVERAVLNTLLAEKQAEWLGYNAVLSSRFQLDPAKNYGLDLDSGEVVRSPDSDGTSAETVRTLKDPVERQALVRLLTVRRLCEMQLSSLELLLAEKRTALQGQP